MPKAMKILTCSYTLKVKFFLSVLCQNNISTNGDFYFPFCRMYGHDIKTGQ